MGSRVRVAFISVGVLLLLGLSLLFAPNSRDRVLDEDDPAFLSRYSPGPNGARAMALWLEELGYDVRSLERTRFAIDPATDVFIIFSPFVDFAPAETSEVIRWVEQGGTLIVAASEVETLYDRLDLVSVRRSDSAETAVPAQPILNDPPVRKVAVETRTYLRPRDVRWVPLLSAEGGADDPIGLVATIGQGRIYVLSDPWIFANENIGEADNAAFILNLLSDVPSGGVIVFDEYHHGLTEHGTFLARMVREPWGWAALYVSVMTILFLAFRGRRFGRAVPEEVAGARRTRAEYVSTVAMLLRGGGKIGWLREEYLAQVKRSLGARFGVPASRPASEFVAALAARRPAAERLAAPLVRLENGRGVGEVEVIRLVREIESAREAILGAEEGRR